MGETRQYVVSLPTRDKDSRKGDNGRAGVIAGSDRFTGAPALCGQAAMRAGADLVKVLTSESVRDVVAGFSKDLIVQSYSGRFLTEDDADRLGGFAKWGDVLVAGPGLGRPDPETLRDVVDSRRCVLDADAIHQTVLEADLSHAVLTPHRGEVERLGDPERFAAQTGAVILLKGPTDRVFSPEGLEAEIERGDPTMTAGGTGDVLAGVVGGLIAQGMSRVDAAEVGARANGVAGEEAAGEYGNGALASDIVERLPETLRNLEEM